MLLGVLKDKRLRGFHLRRPQKWDLPPQEPHAARHVRGEATGLCLRLLLEDRRQRRSIRHKQLSNNNDDQHPQ